MGMGVPMSLAGIQQAGEGARVQPVIAGGVELHGLEGGAQERRISLLVGDGVAQPVQHLAKILAGH